MLVSMLLQALHNIIRDEQNILLTCNMEDKVGKIKDECIRPAIDKFRKMSHKMEADNICNY